MRRTVVRHLAGAVMDLRKAANRSEVLRGNTKDVLELLARFFVATELEQRAAKGDAC